MPLHAGLTYPLPGPVRPAYASWAALTPLATGLIEPAGGKGRGRRSRGRGRSALGSAAKAPQPSVFTFILGVLQAVILVVGKPQDALFGVVLVTNALIGIGQELRAKCTLDRLAALSAPRVRVIRDRRQGRSSLQSWVPG